jgi:site-specific DNA-methyltransferase (adenine-specific)
MELNKIYKGDCLQLLKKLPDKYCDVFVDPPYNVGKDYGECKDNLSEEAYAAFLLSLLTECKRVSKTLTVYTPHKHQSLIWYLLGPEFKQITLWHPAKNGFYSGLVNKTANLLTNATPDKAEQIENIWKVQLPGLGYFSTEKRNEHPGYTTEDVIGKVISRLCKSNIICDPCMGSGTTALAARKLGKDFIGFELNEKYIKVANNRLKNELGMFQ